MISPPRKFFTYPAPVFNHFEHASGRETAGSAHVNFCLQFYVYSYVYVYIHSYFSQQLN